jgi:hypothetical protein
VATMLQTRPALQAEKRGCIFGQPPKKVRL